MKKKQPFGADLKEKLQASARDRVHKFLLADNTVRGAFINGTRMVNEMRANFGYGILETLISGHAYLAAGLLSANLKGNDRVALDINCSGPVKGLSVEVNSFGEVRGYLKNYPIPLDKPLEDFDMSKFFGNGLIKITKYLEDLKQPYTGQTILQYGNIAEDLAYYFFTSEQTPTVFNLSVQFDNDGNVTGAGGLFLQAMPGASEATLEQLENIISKLESPGALMAENQEPGEIIETSFKELGPKVLDSYRIEFFCRCSDKTIGNYIQMLPVEDLAEIAQNGPFPVVTTCHNCNTEYHFSKEDIQIMAGRRFN